MREVCRVRSSDAEARRCMVCNGVAEVVRVDDKVGPLVAHAVKRRIAGVERLLRQAAEQGEIRARADFGASAKALVAFLIGLNTISKVVRDEAQLWAMCQDFLLGLGVSRDAVGTGAAHVKG